MEFCVNRGQTLILVMPQFFKVELFVNKALNLPANLKQDTFFLK